jgi:hypothetical protein
VGQTIIPLIVFAVIMIVKLMSVASRAGNSTSFRPRTPQNPPTDTEEERMRRFMEAVGLPPGSTPPPPVRPRTSTPVERPLMPVQPPNQFGLPPGQLRRVPPMPTPAPAQTPLPSPRPTFRHVTSLPQKVLPMVAPVVPGPAAFSPPARVPSPAALQPSQPAPTAAQPNPPAAKALLRKLRDPGAIREAIVLREILGPPKGIEGDINLTGGYGRY